MLRPDHGGEFNIQELASFCEIYGIKRSLTAATKDENIGFDGYIGTWILRIYRRYIDGYFYINIGN